VGVTAAGPPELARAKSAAGIGALLLDGIGDTVRVSYTGPPHEEVRAAYEILQAVGLHRAGPELLSCPTCGRCRVDLVRVVEEVRGRLGDVTEPITVAVMGCEVNGPGEARSADVGLACGNGGAWLFCRGERVRRVEEADMIDALLEEAGRMARLAKECRVL
jgi:(E)-4-hydroxy-3-methylbut-2-enyl-diphosphate synthase